MKVENAYYLLHHFAKTEASGNIHNLLFRTEEYAPQSQQIEENKILEEAENNKTDMRVCRINFAAGRKKS